MDIAHLASFYEVVLRGSFSTAADTLGVSKGMLSRHVSALESSLNAQLLQRTTRRLSLTEAGKTLYQQAGRSRAGSAGGAGYSGADRRGWRSPALYLPGQYRRSHGERTADQLCHALPGSGGGTQLHQPDGRHESGRKRHRPARHERGAGQSGGPAAGAAQGCGGGQPRAGGARGASSHSL